MECKSIFILIFSCLVSGCGFAQDYPKALTVGDRAPGLAVFQWVKGTPIQQFEKNHVYLVEFGATWCTPCAAAIPHLSDLALKYKNEVQIISVFVKEIHKDTADLSYVDGVVSYVKNQGDRIQYNVAVDGPGNTVDADWLEAAKKAGIPYSFIIDKNGFISWISSDAGNLESIIAYVNSDEYKLETNIGLYRKIESRYAQYDAGKLLLIDGNGGADSDFLYRSILRRSSGNIRAGHQDYITSFREMNPEEHMELANFLSFQGRVQEVNATVEHLYYMAYGDTLWNKESGRNVITGRFHDLKKYPFQASSYGQYWPRPVLKVKNPDSLVIQYDYSLKVPREKGSAQYMRDVMRKDLANYFGYKVNVVSKLMPCWKLISLPYASTVLKTKTPGREFAYWKSGDSLYFSNAAIRDILFRLIYNYGYGFVPSVKAELAPFIDATNISGDIDFAISSEEYKAMRAHDFESVKSFLSKMGLRLVKSTKRMRVVEIWDR